MQRLVQKPRRSYYADNQPLTNHQGNMFPLLQRILAPKNKSRRNKRNTRKDGNTIKIHENLRFNEAIWHVPNTIDGKIGRKIRNKGEGNNFQRIGVPNNINKEQRQNQQKNRSTESIRGNCRQGYQAKSKTRRRKNCGRPIGIVYAGMIKYTPNSSAGSGCSGSDNQQPGGARKKTVCGARRTSGGAAASKSNCVIDSIPFVKITQWFGELSNAF